MKKILFYCCVCLILVILAALVINPSKYISTCYNGLCIWAINVVPSLLPFFFITTLLNELKIANKIAGNLHHISKFLYRSDGTGAYVQLMSIISGYPVGAKMISELYKQGAISKKQSTKLSVFCSTSGPSFIIGSVGSIMFSSVKIGVVIFVCHILSAIINGVIFRKYGDNQPIRPLLQKNGKSENVLYDCALSSVLSCLTVGAFIAVFFVFSQILSDVKLIYPLEQLFTYLFKDQKKAAAFTAGLIECTNGCNMLAKTQGILAVPLCCALISFGGVSVIFQSIAFLKSARANVKIFLFSKLLQMISSFVLCLVACLCFKIS
ncbi:MAG: hypothetical protein IJW13_04205 [Clostridia bacterium]|nr:hypothetical protein [Clostridia bacterium]